jgi:D-3-phosphoglycerate dehydrogenase/C-terminal binding protein
MTAWSEVSGERSVVVVIDSRRRNYVGDATIETALLGSCGELRVLRVDDENELRGEVEDAAVIISWHQVPLRGATLRRLTRCRGIVRAAVGVDTIDLVEAGRLGIPVCNVPDYGTEEVADHTLALILALLRKLPAARKHVDAGGWEWRALGSVARLRGLRLGIVGLGRIGIAVARRAVPFGFDISFYDPHLPSGIDKALGIARHESLDALFAAADVVTLHVPLTGESRGMVNGELLRRARPGLVLVNTARGELVDHAALIDALDRGQVGHVGLDVVAGEPSIPRQLVADDRVILTPHAGFYADASLSELRTKAAGAAIRFLRGEHERSIVNGVELHRFTDSGTSPRGQT